MTRTITLTDEEADIVMAALRIYADGRNRLSLQSRRAKTAAEELHDRIRITPTGDKI